ncbi:MAG: CDP-glucose 4,6-dehydratase [Bacillota bacterium]|nr:CDP-glucose 4,6-dehydratase [Bacillota bacterium]MDW7684824.1 CDP-glucose 4,6-dehydratase [Bacillota bacterium]
MNDVYSQTYQGKTVLITGDSGFKGSWLSICLLKLGARVIGYSLPPRTVEDNYRLCRLDKHLTHINGDINDFPHLLQVFRLHQPEIVFHLAAQPIVLESYRNPLATFQTNIMGTANVMAAVGQVDSVRAVVIVTSDKCYENREWIYRYRENDRLGGKDPYSASKAAAEIVTSSYRDSFFSDEDSPVVATARAGNVIGGGDWSPYRIIPDCIRALQADQPVIIRNPKSVRPWQHVLDSLSGYLQLGAYLYIYGNTYSGPWNFGPLNENTATVLEMVRELIRQWGDGEYRINAEKDGLELPEAQLLHLDSSKAVSCLKWHPVLNLHQAIELTIKEYRIAGLSPEQILNQRIAHIDFYNHLKTTLGRVKYEL